MSETTIDAPADGDSWIDHALIDALYIGDGCVRWDALQRDGATDEAIYALLADLWRSEGIIDTTRYATFRGGDHPAFWHGTTNARRYPDLDGRALITRTRRLLEIPMPTAPSMPAPIDATTTIDAPTNGSPSAPPSVRPAHDPGIVRGAPFMTPEGHGVAVVRVVRDGGMPVEIEVCSNRVPGDVSLELARLFPPPAGMAWALKRGDEARACITRADWYHMQMALWPTPAVEGLAR